MFNLGTRVQAAANQAMTSSVVIAAIVVAISLLQLWKAHAWSIDSTTIQNIKLATTVKKLFQYGSVNKRPKENNKISFDLELDLSPLFNWNTKQVFVYLTASYNGTDGEQKVTYWDKILKSKNDAKLKQHVKSKYSVWDIEDGFNGRDANVKLEWNIQPWVGPMIYGATEPETTFTFSAPKGKTDKKVKKNKSA